MSTDTGNMSNRLFVTGMFRSGTTLLARMLHTHDDIACASDPYRPFFNCFRDAVADGCDIDVDAYDPLGDYFADDTRLKLYDAIQSATLDRSFPDEERDRLYDRIEGHGTPFSPRIYEEVDEIRGETFHEVYKHLLSAVPVCYGDGDESWHATKEVWTTEFTPVLHESFPDARFIQVVRDPRAVCASKNVQERSKYPWLFLIRQWRKLATLARAYDRHQSIQDQVLVVRYEDLVSEPRVTAERMYEFLEIGMDEETLNPANFVDGSGDQWLQNTSYDDSDKASFNTDSVDKWRTTLEGRIVRYIEHLCQPEMAAYGYDTARTESLSLPDDLALDPPAVPVVELADWITDHYGGETASERRTAVGDELIRQRLFTCDRSLLDQLDDEDVRPYALSRAVLSEARDVLQGSHDRGSV